VGDMQGASRAGQTANLPQERLRQPLCGFPRGRRFSRHLRRVTRLGR